MQRGLNYLARWPAGVPGRKPSGAQVWREPPKREERVSRSTEPLSLMAQWPGALSSLMGEKPNYPLPLPQLLSSPELWEGMDHLLSRRSPPGWQESKLPHSGIILPQNTLSGQVPILFS